MLTWLVYCLCCSTGADSAHLRYIVDFLGVGNDCKLTDQASTLSRAAIAFTLTTDHGYAAYRIPVEDDHNLMTPGKTDYLYDSAGARIPAWRITLSLAQRPITAAFDTGRHTVSAELDTVEQSVTRLSELQQLCSAKFITRERFSL